MKLVWRPSWAAAHPCYERARPDPTSSSGFHRRVRDMQARRRQVGLPVAGQVTSLELFFDLVFVFTITQLTATVQPGGWEVTGRAALLLLILWWMYGGDAWLTKSAPPATWRPRGLPGLGGDGNLLPA